jgi:tetratricopeptide (TPR) repeat protein/predicted Ser/Thr protein kinase
VKIDAVRWQRIQSLFHDALQRSPEERAAFLAEACADDPSLASDVASLLATDARRTSLLDRPLGDVAHDVLDGSVPHLERVGSYRIERVLGHGGMGVVYLGVRDDLGSRAAVKVLRDASLSPLRRERFSAEQRTLAQLDHPSIARLLDAGTLADGTPYFIMEYVDGDALTAYCARHSAGIEQTLRLFLEVCHAVQYAHSRAVVHRDLKPSNIMVTGSGSIKLLDFGIAKQLESLDVPAYQTQQLRALTPGYAAPEQIRGEPIGTSADVYALGVILYELLTGALPFDAAGAATTPLRPSIRVQRNGPAGAVKAATFAQSEWADLDLLCLTALQPEPQLRYASVEAMSRDIAHLLQREPLEARPPTARYVMSRFVRRRARALAGAAALIVLAGSLAGFDTVRVRRARDAAQLEAERVQRIQSFMLDLFGGGDPSAGPADTMRVVALLQRGVLAARALDDDPAIQTELYQTLGGIYQQLGDLPRADSLLSMALEERRAAFGDAHPDVARSRVALGMLRADQAKLDEAEQLVRTALHDTRAALPANDPAIARASAALGVVLQHRGAYDESIAALQDALRLQQQGLPADRDVAHTMAELANTYFYAGNYAASDSLNLRLIALHSEIHGAHHPLVADALINLGASEFQRGNYAQQEAYLRRALPIYTGYHGPDHYEVAATMNMLGQSLVYQDRYDEAMDMLRQALSMRERIYGAVHPRVASSANELGAAALKRGDYSEAESYFTRMAAIYEQVYADDHYLKGIAQSNLGSVQLQAGKPAQAEPYLRRAIALFERTLPADHVNTAIARIKLGRALVRQARHAQAEPLTRAGYEVLVKQANPSLSFLRSAREDLAVVYDAIGRSADAARFRAELAAKN